MHKQIIITGAPGTGKTTLIQALAQKGYSCYPEISRQIIKAQQLENGTKTPWEDLSGFIDLVYQQTLETLKTPIHQHTFVDRGLPDTIAYLQATSKTVPDRLSQFPFKTYYEDTVFLAPFWEAIYTPDPQRLQSAEDAQKIHKSLITVYNDLGFNIEVLPKSTLTKRITFIEAFI